MKENLLNWIFVIVTGFVAYHGLSYRNKEGEKDTIRLLFGCIALLYCIWAFFKDILGVTF